MLPNSLGKLKTPPVRRNLSWHLFDCLFICVCFLLFLFFLGLFPKYKWTFNYATFTPRHNRVITPSLVSCRPSRLDESHKNSGLNSNSMSGSIPGMLPSVPGPGVTSAKKQRESNATTSQFLLCRCCCCWCRLFAFSFNKRSANFMLLLCK